MVDQIHQSGKRFPLPRSGSNTTLNSRKRFSMAHWQAKTNPEFRGEVLDYRRLTFDRSKHQMQMIPRKASKQPQKRHRLTPCEELQGDIVLTRLLCGMLVLQ